MNVGQFRIFRSISQIKENIYLISMAVVKKARILLSYVYSIENWNEIHNFQFVITDAFTFSRKKYDFAISARKRKIIE